MQASNATYFGTLVLSLLAALCIAGCASWHERLQICLVAAQEKVEADILIAPPVNVSGMSAKDEPEQAILAGHEATRAALPRIKAQLAQASGV